MVLDHTDLAHFERMICDWDNVTRGLSSHWTYKAKLDLLNRRDELESNDLNVMSECELFTIIGEL